jgi:hypothetical protein
MDVTMRNIVYELKGGTLLKEDGQEYRKTIALPANLFSHSMYVKAYEMLFGECMCPFWQLLIPQQLINSGSYDKKFPG